MIQRIFADKFLQALSLRECNKNKSYFLTKPYVVGTQKNRLTETVLLST